MAFKTNKRLGLGGEIHDIEEFCRVALLFQLIVALGIVFEMCNGKAPRTMAGLAVDERETGFRSDLLPMQTVFEVVGNLVMLVTLGHAVVSTNILGIKPADNHPLILANGKNRTILLEFGTGDKEQRNEGYKSDYHKKTACLAAYFHRCTLMSNESVPSPAGKKPAP